MSGKAYFNSRFPEVLFPAKPDLLAKYRERVINGFDYVSDKNVLICGLARDIGGVVEHTIARLEKIGAYFKTYNVYIVENDSIDDTKAKLKGWANINDRVKVSLNNFNTVRHSQNCSFSRTVDMVRYRNIYLKYICQFILDNAVSYVIILDMDLLGGWSYEGILNSFGHTGWDVMGSNGIIYQKDTFSRLFYDSWAFRKLGHPEPHDQSEINLLVYNRGEPVILVDSCFGGLALYRAKSLEEDVEYKAGDCDHPTLHRQLKEKGYKVFLNPSQIALYNRTVYNFRPEDGEEQIEKC